MLEKKSLNFCLYCLQIIGLNPHKFDIIAKIRVSVIVIIQITVTVLIAVQLAFHYDEMAIFGICVGFICAIGQGLIKAFGVITYRGSFIELFDITNLFWPMDIYGEEHEKSFKKMHRFSFKAITSYGVTIGMTFLLYNSTPFIIRSPEREIPVPMYSILPLNVTWFYVGMYTLDYTVSIISWISIIGFDGLFFAMLSLSYCEMEKIKIGLVKHTTHQELSNIINQHVIVLDFVDKINSTFSILLVYQIGTSLAMICMGMYLFAESGDDINQAATWVNFVFSVSSQIFVYCFVGNIVADQVESIADVAYDIDWYNWKDVKMKKYVILILGRARRGDQITAGGLWALNMETFASVVQKAFSIYTFMQTMKVVD